MTLRFAANLSFMFPELAWERRFAAAAGCGFTGVEFNPPLPYEVAPQAFARMLADHGLACPLVVAPLGTGAAAFGHACLPSERAAFAASIDTAIEYALAAGAPLVHPSAGRATSVPHGEAEAAYVENLAWAAGQVASAGLKLCIEPVCEFRAPGFFLSTTTQAIDVIGRSGSDDIGLIFDVFHVEKQEGSALERLPELLPRIMHVQVSDTPNRNRPGLGDIDFASIFGLLERDGYSGWIGCEYSPERGQSDDLDWAAPWWPDNNNDRVRGD